ncbi:unnamed protein product, partial [Mesorhabditis belari]|uniref:LRAT domain-containing protein n=1 Tax=Mesorhabditis belari TaxID=2138241 RepID=A0AAF3ER39_9BILA
MTSYLHNTLHSGINIGHGKVVHYSGHGIKNKSKEVFIRTAKLVGNFVTLPSRIKVLERFPLAMISFNVRERMGEDIAKIAESHAKVHEGKGAYNLFSNNCQHFVTMCATGEKFIMHKGLSLFSVFSLNPIALVLPNIRTSSFTNYRHRAKYEEIIDERQPRKIFCRVLEELKSKQT